MTAVEAGIDIHHGAPGCLLGLFDAATGGLVEWSEFDAKAERLSVEVRGLSREDLRTLIEGSTRQIPTPERRRLHQGASAFVRWGRRGALEPGPLRLAVLLAARPLQMGHVPLEALTRHRAGSLKGAGRCDPPLVGEGHPLRPRGLRAVFSRRTGRPRELRGGDREGRRQHTGLGRRKWPGSTAPSRTDEGRERIRDARDRCVR